MVENRTSFGLDAGAYSTFRPTYPAALYRWLSGLCPSHDAALDCATGTGQAAVALADYFSQVVATDTDPAQIASATPDERVSYVVVGAEEIPAELGRFDIVTIAQGAHWFDLPLFYERLRPLLRPDAVIAIWGYSHPRISSEIDAVLTPLLFDAVDPWWAQGNRVIMDHYRSIPFPWEEIAAPEFTIEEHWTLADFFGYVRTWSAYKRMLAEGQPDPLISVANQLNEQCLWSPEATRPVVFDVYLRAGRGSSALD